MSNSSRNLQIISNQDKLVICDPINGYFVFTQPLIVSLQHRIHQDFMNVTSMGNLYERRIPTSRYCEIDISMRASEVSLESQNPLEQVYQAIEDVAEEFLIARPRRKIVLPQK